MFVPNLYNGEQLANYLKRQIEFAWDLEKDFPWASGIDMSKMFVPVNPHDLGFKETTAEEQVVLSQYIGMMINSTICEMELALDRSKAECWEKMMDRFPTNPEMEALGVNFFIEEHKHSLAFEKFLTLFAKQTNVTREELRSILPIFDQSKIEDLIRMNGYIGGMAMWWVVAAVEEESIYVYQTMSGQKKNIDPLFYELHRQHFLEEARHAGYAFLMLDLFRQRSNNDLSKIFKKIDFIISEILQITWMLGELLKSRKIIELRDRHPFYETLARLMPVLGQNNPWKIIGKLFQDAPYISLILNPQKNRHLMQAVSEYQAWKIPHSFQDLRKELGLVSKKGKKGAA